MVFQKDGRAVVALFVIRRIRVQLVDIHAGRKQK